MTSLAVSSHVLHAPSLPLLVLRYKEAVEILEKILATNLNVLPTEANRFQPCLMKLQAILALETDEQRVWVIRQTIDQLTKKQTIPHVSATDVSTPPQEDEQSKKRSRAIQDTILRPSTNLSSMQTIAGLESVKRVLRESLVLPLQYPHLFTGNRQPWKRVLMYGPPGTGKTKIAQSLAAECQATFYCVSSSDLISSWVGESEKLIKDLFAHARVSANQQKAIIFIDEVDSIARKRTSSEEDHTRRIKTELLRQMEGADSLGQNDPVFLLCATNCPWELDSAFLRRFQKRVYVPLPDEAARAELIKSIIGSTPCHLSDDDFQEIMQQTDGFSGSDIVNMMRDTLFEPIRELQASLDLSFENSNTVRQQHFNPRAIQVADFLRSVSQAQKTVTDEELMRFEEFA